MIIQSVSNNLIKHAASLKVKKFRHESGQFLAEGIKLISDICVSNSLLVKTIFVTENSLNRINLTEYSEKIVLVTKKVIDSLCSSTTNQEIVAIIDKPKQQLKGNFVLFLNKLQDPGNLGTILRTALASGFSLILNECADIYSPKVVQSSMGAILSVPFIKGGISDLIKLKEKGFKIFALDLDGQDLFCVKKENPVCLIVGNEGNGIEKHIKEVSDKTLTIPMEKTESLNAAISAAISMYYFRY